MGRMRGAGGEGARLGAAGGAATLDQELMCAGGGTSDASLPSSLGDVGTLVTGLAVPDVLAACLSRKLRPSGRKLLKNVCQGVPVSLCAVGVVCDVGGVSAAKVLAAGDAAAARRARPVRA